MVRKTKRHRLFLAGRLPPTQRAEEGDPAGDSPREAGLGGNVCQTVAELGDDPIDFRI